MRSLPYPEARGEAGLTRAARLSLAAATLLLAATLFTGAATSPLLPLLIGSLILAVRYVRSPAAALAPLVVSAILVAAEIAGGDPGAASVGAALLVAVSAVPGWLWRRDSLRSAAAQLRLDDILSQAGRSSPAGEADAAEELADLDRALASLAGRIAAHGIILWDVVGTTVRARAVFGARPTQQVRLAGDPLGWAWEQGMRMRLEPPPRWAPADTTVVAERLRRSEDEGMLVSYAFTPANMPADDYIFDEAGVYIRGLLSLQEARAGAVAGQRRMSALLGGLRRIPGELQLETLAADLCATAMNITDATGAVIGMWDGEQGEILALCGDDGGPRPGDTFAPPACELGLAIRADTMLVRDSSDWKLGATCLAHRSERWDNRPRAMAALPLRGPAGIIGIIAVWTAKDRSLDNEALDLLHALTPYAALHLEHARAFGRLRETAERDALTQLRNRRAFDDVFASEAHRFERYLRPLSLLILDLDHFKPINDRYGHEAGDEVLRRVSQTIAAAVRDVDTAARFGGEEFVILMPETTRVAATEVAERIRTSVAALLIDWRGTPINVRISIGVATAPDSIADPKGLIGAADAALYRAKAAGRDRVGVA